MPGLIHRQLVGVIIEVGDIARVLAPIGLANVAITDADDEVAGAVAVGDAGLGGLQAVRVLQHVAEDEHPGLAFHLLGWGVGHSA
jgi:hypothetical protein